MRAIARWLTVLGFLAAIPSVGLAQHEGPIRYLLLQHGSVLRGQVTEQNARLSVTIDHGNQVLLDSKQVLFLGDSLESLYEYQRRSIKQWGTGEHWQLTDWCIQQGLLDQAVFHFRELEKQGPSSPNFKQLEFKLKSALIAQMKEFASKNDKPSSSGSHEKPTTEGNNAHLLKPVPQEGSSSKRSITDLPTTARRNFQSEVLPVLVQRCGQSGCHGRLDSEFHVRQPVGDQAALILEKDLENVLRFIDPSKPAESRLLEFAVKRHGIQQKPSLSVLREEELAMIERIENWVRSLSMTQSSPMPAQYPLPSQRSLDKPMHEDANIKPASATVPLDGRRPNRSAGTTPRDRNAKLSRPPRTASPPVVLSGTDLQEIEDAIAALEKKQESAPKPADPFDPNVFNQKFGTKRP